MMHAGRDRQIGGRRGLLRSQQSEQGENEYHHSDRDDMRAAGECQLQGQWSVKGPRTPPLLNERHQATQ